MDFDPYNENPDNLVLNEVHSFTQSDDLSITIIPRSAPFFLKGAVVEGMYIAGTYFPLIEGRDFTFAMMYNLATRATGMVVYGSIILHNRKLINNIRVTYRSLGDFWKLDDEERLIITSNRFKQRETSWETMTGHIHPLPEFEKKALDDVGNDALEPKIKELADIFDRDNFTSRLFPSTLQEPFMLWFDREVGDLSNDGKVNKDDVDLWLSLYRDPMPTPALLNISSDNAIVVTIEIDVTEKGGGKTDATLISTDHPTATIDNNIISFEAGTPGNYIFHYTLQGLLGQTRVGTINMSIIYF